MTTVLLIVISIGTVTCSDGLTEYALKQFIIILAKVPLHRDYVLGLLVPEK